MSSIENRIVSIKFDNGQFEQAVKKTLTSLEALNKGLKLDGAAKGLTDVSSAASRFNLGHIGESVDKIASKFGAMEVAALAAIGAIAARAASAGAQMVKSLTIKPVIDGFREYETQLNAIQTILANTAHEGTNLKQVNAALDELNHYADQTIYNFTEMTRNIGTFTAAGVSLKTSTAAIKGIANLAAISGSNAQQASAAMYQLSQAMAAGRATLIDWNSVVNAGMGGKVFQDALIETARVHGVAIDKMIKDAGSFRDSLEKGWLTTDVLTETLAKFTGDLSAAQLKAMGYNDKQIAGIIKMGNTARDAATKVKTFTQLIATLQEAASSGWATTWRMVFGDFEEAKKTWTGVNNVLSGFISASSDARNKVVKDWKDLGGRTVIIEAIKNAFEALVAFVKPIRDAFREIFPAKTGKDLYNLSVSIRNFTEGLKIGADTANKLKRTFAGVFAVFGIGVEIVKQILSTFFQLFGVAQDGSGSFLGITASIGDFLVKLHDVVVEGGIVKGFFKGLGAILSVPIKVFTAFASVVASMFEGFDSSGANDIKKNLDPLVLLASLLERAWARVGNIFKAVWDYIEPLTGQLGSKIEEMMSGISDGLANTDFSGVLDAINTGLFAVIAIAIKDFLNDGFDFGGAGILDSIKESFDGLSGSLQAMQTNIQAGTLIKIAGAVALLTASIVALSLIDSEKLTKALTAISAMFLMLVGSVALFSKAIAGGGLLQLPLLSVGLIGLAIAIDLLTVSVLALSTLSWEELAKGLTGVVTILAALVVAIKFMPEPAGLIASSAGLILLAGAIKILASAVNDLSGLSWEDMAKGLVGVGALLAALGLFAKFATMNAGGLAAGAGIVLLATGIKILASALIDIATMSWGEIAKGLVVMAAGLTAIGLALTLIPPTSLLSAAAIFVTAASLGMIGDALQNMGGMSWGEIAKGLTVLAGALTIIGLATTGMIAALPGAAALLVVAGALAVLTPVLIALSGMTWGEVATGLTVLAAALAIIGIAGAALGPVVPVLIGLGAAVALLGVGMLAAGAGVLAFSAGLTALSISGVAGAAALVGIVTTILASLPKIMGLLGQVLVSFANTLAQSAPAIAKAMTVIIGAMITAINNLAPKVINTLLKLLLLLLTTLNKYTPKLVDAGAKLIISLLNGLAQKLPGIITAATNVIVAFINGIARNQPRVTAAGVKMIISYINGVANQIRSSGPAMGKAGANLATAIIEGMARGLLAGVGTIAAKARQVAQSALNAAKAVLGIHSPSREFEKIGKYVNEGFLKGLQGNSSDVTTAFNKMRDDLKSLMRSSAEDVDRLEKKLSRLKDARHKDKQAIRETTKELAIARKEHKESSAAYSLLTKRMTDERDKLKKLANSYDKLTEKLKAAQDKLDAAKKTRDDYKAAITSQYSDLPEITANTKLEDYLNSLREQIVKTKAFAAMLQKLRERGLNDTLYKELLAKGTDAMPFVSQLLDSGQAGVDELNGLDTTLEKTAASLGKTASNTLYQAAVDSAQGLVDGLKKQQAKIEKVMEDIAEAMVKAIKKKLKIKSPSREFADIGIYSAEGLASGLMETSSAVEASAENVGKNAILALRKSISGMRELIEGNVDMDPTIRPVIDLTGIKKDASNLIAMLPDQLTLSTGASYGQAKNARVSYDATELAKAQANAHVLNTPDSVTFTQNNYSPKALTSAEIYRQTKNQLSVAKGALST